MLVCGGVWCRRSSTQTCAVKQSVRRALACKTWTRSSSAAAALLNKKKKKKSWSAWTSFPPLTVIFYSI